MTIETTSRRVTYIGNGAISAFDFNFVVPEDQYLGVRYENPETGAIEELAYGQDYSVVGLGWPEPAEENTTEVDRYVTLPGPLPNGHLLQIYRKDMPFLQKKDMSNQGAYFLETLEKGLDINVMYLQQLMDTINQFFRIEPDPKTDNFVADFSDCRHLNVTLGASVLVGLGFPGPGVYTLKISQDGTGGRQFIFVQDLRWLAGLEPAWHLHPYTYAVISFRYDGEVIDAMGDVFFGESEDLPQC